MAHSWVLLGPRFRGISRSWITDFINWTIAYLLACVVQVIQGFQKDRISQLSCIISDKARKGWLMTIYLFPPLCHAEKVPTPPAGQLPGPYWPLSRPCLYLWCLRCPRSWDHWPLATDHSLPGAGHHMATALPFHVPRPACCCCTRTTIPDLVVKTQFGENTHLSWTLHQENTLISRNRKSLCWDLAIARYQPRPCGQQRGFAPTFFKNIFGEIFFFGNIFGEFILEIFLAKIFLATTF